MIVLQTLPHPAVGLCTTLDLYVRMLEGSWWSFDESAVVFRRGGLATTDTYFGVLPTGKWFRHTTIRRVEIAVDVTGDLEIEAVHNSLGKMARVVATGRLEHDGELVLELPDLSELADGHVFVRARAMSDGARLRNLAVRTHQRPEREVRLGLAVTTFNRQEYLRRNVERLDAFVGRREDLAEVLRLVVVDNGRNVELAPTEALATEVVGNRNLGGAGGFARGMMEHRDAGWATHVLLMDDDIVFEPDVVGRMHALFAFATDPHLCVAGAMLIEEHPAVQFEAGARVNPRATIIWQALAGERNLTKIASLVANDVDEAIDYGGWWCFGLPLDLTPDYPFPAFVRGDDVSFGLQHTRGHVVTFNGIGVWHQDFALKNTSVAFYYESRNLPVVLCVAFPDEFDALALRKRLLERTMRFATGFKYEAARSVIDGVEAFLDGPDRFLEVPADERNDQLRERYTERLQPLSPEHLHVPAWTPPPSKLPMVWRLASLATIGGHLLPRRIRRGRTWAVRAQDQPVMATLGAEAIVFRDDPSGKGVTVARDQAAFRDLMRRLVRINRRISDEFDGAAEAWRAAYPKLVSEGYWRDQFADPTSTVDA